MMRIKQRKFNHISIWSNGKDKWKICGTNNYNSFTRVYRLYHNVKKDMYNALSMYNSIYNAECYMYTYADRTMFFIAKDASILLELKKNS